MQLFDFGRAQMSPSAPAINGHNTISVTCTRAQQANNRDVQVNFVLQAVPADPTRYMRDSHLGYLRYTMYVDAARTRAWGDGSGSTFVFRGCSFSTTGTESVPSPFRCTAKWTPGKPPLPGQWLGLVATRLEYDVDCR